MKKYFSIATMVLAALMSMTIVSCDDDDDIAYTLEGTWEGDMYIQSSYNGHTYDATYSEICFLKDPYKWSSGDGYWVDYYSNAPWDYVANHIDWTVRKGVIYVHFVEENSDIQIHDYSLSGSYFTGRIYMGSKFVDFRLRHTSSPNWNEFGWGYDYWDDYYYDYWSKGDIMKAPANKNESPRRSLRTI